jgi:hypothetical protein
MTEFWRKWLIVAAGVVGSAGLGLALLSSVGASGVRDAIFDLVYFPGEPPAPADDVALFVIGVTGAVMVGWAAMMLFLLIGQKTSALLSTWQALTIGLLAWFVVDGIVSVTAGATGNLVINVALLAMFAPALAATRSGRRATR